MPRKYVLELVADWLAAGRVYGNLSIEEEIKWWENCRDMKLIHPKTKKMIDSVFETLRKYE